MLQALSFTINSAQSGAILTSDSGVTSVRRRLPAVDTHAGKRWDSTQAEEIGWRYETRIRW